MAGKTVHLLIFSRAIPILELWTLAGYNTLSYCDKRVPVFYTSHHDRCIRHSHEFMERLTCHYQIESAVQAQN